MCECVFCGRSIWQEVLEPENICSRPHLKTPANTHTHLNKHTKHAPTHTWLSHHHRLATHTEIRSCEHTRLPVEHRHRHGRHTSGTVTIATKDWSCLPGLARRVTARESVRDRRAIKRAKDKGRERRVLNGLLNVHCSRETKGEREREREGENNSKGISSTMLL